jgi:hypothetical protein
VAEDGRCHEGYCNTALTIKYLDGKLNTFQSTEDRNAKQVVKEKEVHDKGLLEAASFLKGNNTSPSSLEEAAYQFAAVKGRKGSGFKDLYNVVDRADILKDVINEMQEQRGLNFDGPTWQVGPSLKTVLKEGLPTMKKEPTFKVGT